LLLLLGCGAQNPGSQTPDPAIPIPGSMESYDPTLVGWIEEAVQAVTHARHDPHSWRDLGQLYEAHLMLEWAEPAYAQAVELNATDARVQYRLALTRMRNGDLHGGLASLAEVLRLQPDYGPAWCKQGIGLFDLGQMEEARTSFETAIDIDPEESAGQIGLAQIALHAGRPELALSRLEHDSVQSGPNAPLAHRLRAKALFQLGREGEAQAEIQRGRGARLVLNDPWTRELVAFKKGTSALLLRASRLIDRGRADKAVELLVELLAREPENPRVARKLGVAQAKLENWAQAVAAFALAVKFEPLDAQLRVSLGWAQVMAGDDEAASVTLAAAVQQDPSDETAHAARLAALSNLGRWRGVVEAYSESQVAGISDAGLELATGKAQLELNDAKQALRHFELANQMDSKDSEVWVGITLAHIALGEKAAAESGLQTLRNLAPGHRLLAELRARIDSL